MDLAMAACRTVDPEIFFPTAGESTAVGAHEVDVARAVCARCPIARDCLNWALESGQEFGVWGGTSPDERRAMRRARLPLAV